MICRVVHAAKFVARSAATRTKLNNPLLYTRCQDASLKITRCQRYLTSESKKNEDNSDENVDRNVNIKAFAALAVIGSAIGAFINIRAYERRKRKEQVATEGPSYGAPKLGGDYMLIDQNGKVRMFAQVLCYSYLNTLESF